jgi:hypothetical protein
MASIAKSRLSGLLVTLAALLCSMALFASSAAAAPAPQERGFADTSVADAPEAKGKRGTALLADWSCDPSVPIPAYYIQITCTVFANAYRIRVVCSDGYEFYSPIIFAGQRFSGRGTCGPPWTVRGWGMQRAV